MDKPTIHEGSRIASPATVSVTGSEMLIHINQDWNVEYIGTRAQLEAEGIVPVDTHWPEGRYQTHWQANGLSFSLGRCARPGTRGRLKSPDNDYWAIRFDPDGWSVFDKQLSQKNRALRELLYRHSDEWSRRWREECDASLRARSDKAYQAFRAKIPSLAEPERRRGRKPKASAEVRDE